MAELNCRHFSGYKPCGKSDVCDPSCESRSLVSKRILVVHLEALGAVLRATSILPAIRRQYPDSHITWVTKKPADQLLKNNPLIDRVLTTEQHDMLALSCLQFDIAYCVDKSLAAGGVLRQTTVQQVLGFTVQPRTGSILPATNHAQELWEIGLSDQKKFFENQKPETQLLVESMALGSYQRDPYILQLDDTEQSVVKLRRSLWSEKRKTLIGINTGCSGVIPYKKLTVETHRRLIEKLAALPAVQIVLLGGSEDTLRNQQIAYGLPVINSPTASGLRDGLISTAACDMVITGDSLGMHMAIALNKWVVAWFGPTCAHEIDLYDRGVKVLTKATCSPCWKRQCNNSPMCYDQVDLQQLVNGVHEGMNWLTSSSKRHISETFFSPSL